MIGIYKITSPNKRVYIGQSEDIEKRFGTYRNINCSKQIRLYLSLKKYGVENHIFEIKELCNFEELNIRERYWQDFYNVIGKMGLNCVLTGTDKNPQVVSQETKNKHIKYNQERIITDQTRRNMSNAKKGKKLNDEQKVKMSFKQKLTRNNVPDFSEELRNEYLNKYEIRNILNELKPHYKQKITYSEVHTICNMMQDNVSNQIIRKIYPHISIWTLESIRYKKTFKHISEQYNMNKSSNKGKPVMCITDNSIFGSAMLAAKHYNITKTVIYNHLLGKVDNLLIGKQFKYI